MNYFQVWESKTIASAVKQYFRDLNKPLMTHTLYNKFIEAVKLESEEQRLQEIQALVSKLPISSREILKVLVRHLSKVASRSDRNLMTASNLGVCFGPTLLRPKEETVASIMDIKFSNQACIPLESHATFASVKTEVLSKVDRLHVNVNLRCTIPGCGDPHRKL